MQRKYGRKLSLLLAAVMVSCSLSLSAVTVNAAVVNDLDSSSAYAREAIQSMASKDVISGDTQGNFNPKKTISRAELVTLLVKALGIDTSNLPSKATFTDVPVTHWAFRYVEAASRAGIVSGIGNGKFGVSNLCTREQITAMVLNYFSVPKEAVLAKVGLSDLEKFKDEGKMSNWAKPSIQFSISNKLMSGTSVDMFSPAGSATKEQIAFILYKILNSQEAIQQNAQTLRVPIVTYNGDVLKLAVTPEIGSNEVLVPLEVFRIIGAKVNVDELMTKVSISSSAVDGRNLYMSVGSQNAYLNYTGSGDPFNDAAAQSNLISLNASPKIAGNEVLVPLKAVADAIGIQAEWNANTKLISINDANTVKNPLLYKALKNTLDYKGEYNSNITMSMRESSSNEEFTMQYAMNGAVNGDDSTAKSQISVKLTGLPDQTYQYETVKIGDNIYSKDPDTGKWSLIDKTKADSEGIPYYDATANKAETQKLIDAYGKLSIVYSGKALVNGEEVSKYQFKIGNDILDEFVPSDIVESGMGIGDIYNKGFDFTAEMYVNGQGQLVKQVVKGTGGAQYDEYSVSVSINADNQLTNIGKDIEIVSPVQ